MSVTPGTEISPTTNKANLKASAQSMRVTSKLQPDTGPIGTRNSGQGVRAQNIDFKPPSPNISNDKHPPNRIAPMIPSRENVKPKQQTPQSTPNRGDSQLTLTGSQGNLHNHKEPNNGTDPSPPSVKERVHNIAQEIHTAHHRRGTSQELEKRELFKAIAKESQNKELQNNDDKHREPIDKKEREKEVKEREKEEKEREKEEKEREKEVKEREKEEKKKKKKEKKRKKKKVVSQLDYLVHLWKVLFGVKKIKKK